MNVLVLCTGNICRSPMGEALLRREAGDRRVPLAVGSAGFVTRDRPAEPYATEVRAERGIDIAAHRSRLTTPDLLDVADLVLGMAREHVREAFVTHRAASPRSFTLKELVRRGTAAGGPQGDLEDWLDALDAERDPTELLGSDRRDDIADPMGRSRRRFRACADEIEANIIALADLLWPGDAP
jgi:protein-tyrosine-phosphatase